RAFRPADLRDGALHAELGRRHAFDRDDPIADDDPGHLRRAARVHDVDRDRIAIRRDPYADPDELDLRILAIEDLRQRDVERTDRAAVVGVEAALDLRIETVGAELQRERSLGDPGQLERAVRPADRPGVDWLSARPAIYAVELDARQRQA